MAVTLAGITWLLMLFAEEALSAVVSQIFLFLSQPCSCLSQPVAFPLSIPAKLLHCSVRRGAPCSASFIVCPVASRAFHLHGVDRGRYIPALCAALPVKLRGTNLCC